MSKKQPKKFHLLNRTQVFSRKKVLLRKKERKPKNARHKS